MKVLSNLFGTDKKIGANSVAVKCGNKGQTLNNMFTYSTSEIKIGTWIDGKPLYRKVIVYNNSEIVGSLSKVTDISIAHNISNFNIVCDCRIVTADGYILPTINSTNDTTVTAGVRIHRVGTSAVVLRIINDTWGAKTWYITLMYTKTTD